MTTVRFYIISVLLLLALPGRAQGWEVLPKYAFGKGGRAQVRRIILCEAYGKPSAGFTRLRDSTTIEELVKLSRRQNPAMQLYAAMALADRHYPALHKVFGQLIRKDKPISYQYQAGGSNRVNYLHASEQLYHRIRYAEAAARSVRQPAFITPADSLLYYTILHRMDSTALRLANAGAHVHYTLLENCLEENEAYPGAYADVSLLCRAADPQKAKNSGYATALAAYCREQDIPLLLSFDSNAFAAIAKFPHPAFWPLIEKYRFTETGLSSFDYYQAIAAFNNGHATQLLDSIVRSGFRYRNEASNMATVLRNASLLTFRPVVEKLWVLHHTTRPEFVAQLIQQNPRQAAKIFADGFLTYKVDEQGDFGPSYERGTDSVVTSMLRTIWQQDSADLHLVARHGVKVFNWTELTALCQLDKRYGFPWLKPLLLAELRATHKPYAQYKLVGVLLSYQEVAITGLVKQALTENEICHTFDDTWCKFTRAQLEQLNASELPKK